jgi:cold shock CspA family protein
MQGTIVRLHEKYAFIVSEDGRELFASCDEFDPPNSFFVSPGTCVEFDSIEETDRKPAAKGIRLLDNDRIREHGEIWRTKDNRYGFIMSDRGGTVYFSFLEVVGDCLTDEGTRVTFTLGTDERIGKSRALAIREEL